MAWVVFSADSVIIHTKLYSPDNDGDDVFPTLMIMLYH